MYMKRNTARGIIFILIAILFFILASLAGCNIKEKTYCGDVVEKFRTDAGYKSQAEAHVVFYCNELKKNIDVKVTWNCYANAYVGKNICFSLLDWQTK